MAESIRPGPAGQYQTDIITGSPYVGRSLPTQRGLWKMAPENLKQHALVGLAVSFLTSPAPPFPPLSVVSFPLSFLSVLPFPPLSSFPPCVVGVARGVSNRYSSLCRSRRIQPLAPALRASLPTPAVPPNESWLRCSGPLLDLQSPCVTEFILLLCADLPLCTVLYILYRSQRDYVFIF